MVKLKVAFPKSDTRNTRQGSMLFPSSQNACLPQLPPLVLIICSLPAYAVLTFWGGLHVNSGRRIAARDPQPALAFLCTA